MTELLKKEAQEQELERLAKQLAVATKSLPFIGHGGGTSKRRGCRCPHCGSQSSYRYHEGRWKRCSACGYDRLEEARFDICRGFAKRGYLQQITLKQVKSALEYHAKVYGKQISL